MVQGALIIRVVGTVDSFQTTKLISDYAARGFALAGDDSGVAGKFAYGTPSFLVLIFLNVKYLLLRNIYANANSCVFIFFFFLCLCFEFV